MLRSRYLYYYYGSFRLDRRSKQLESIIILKVVWYLDQTNFLLQLLSWLILPIFDAHTRVQNLQARKVPSNGWFDHSFFRLRPVSRVNAISFCKRATPLFTAVFQHDLSFALASQVLKSMPHLVKLLLHVSLYLS